MAATAEHTNYSEKRGILNRIMDAIDRMYANHPRLVRVERLNAMSDDELARRGLRRQDIVRHVFNDIYYV